MHPGNPSLKKTMGNLKYPKKVALFGFGKFGVQYYKELKKLEHEGRAQIAFVINETGQKNLHFPEQQVYAERSFDYTKLTDIDFAVVVTPVETRLSIIKKISNYTNQLVEKPLFQKKNEEQEMDSIVNSSNFIVLPSLIYRFNPMVQEAKRFISKLNENPITIDCKFINCITDKASYLDPAHEMIHPIDVIDYLFGMDCIESWIDFSGPNKQVIYTKYKNKSFAKYELGWDERLSNKRSIEIKFSETSLSLDLESGEYMIGIGDNYSKQIFSKNPISIHHQLINFIGVLNGEELPIADLKDYKRVFEIIDKSRVRLRKRAKKGLKIAVIGGGIFGVTSAIELSKKNDVYLFEKDNDILTQASLTNQWRHHSGFHYPLSFETASEIDCAKKLFESEFSDAISHSYPSYYCVSAFGNEIPAKRYLAACDLYGLNYEIVSPPSLVDPNTVSVCLRTDEGIYNIDILRDILWSKLNSSQVNVLLNANVCDGWFEKGQKKGITYDTLGTIKSISDFDVIVNATYASLTKTASLWSLDLPVRYEEVELLEIEGEFGAQCLTIIDGPFVSLTSKLKPNNYFISHRNFSVIKRFGDPDIASTDFGVTTNSMNILSAASIYMPQLKNAKIVRSWYQVKAISKSTNEVWERPTVLCNHGFGIWSMLGGKILSSISTAKELSNRLLYYVK